MKRITLTLFASFIVFSCQTQKLKTNDSDGFTYAEIAVKEGGEWIDGSRGHKEYVGGTFKNVSEHTLVNYHTDHSFDIRYEGPGWENQNVGFRLYLDWRNAIDIFGKTVKKRILHEVGQDGFDSYHTMQPWGQDILKAGKSLGVGGFGRLINDTVSHFHQVANTTVKIKNEKKESNVNIYYKKWQTQNHITDLEAKISIFPYDRFSKFVLKTSVPTNGLTTGIVKFDHIELKQNKSNNGQWAYIATYGNQTLVNDTDLLGMAIFYKTDEVEKVLTAKHDHLIVFKPTTKAVTYYMLSAWGQEPEGIKNESEFYSDLNQKLAQLQQNNRLNK